MAKPRRSSGKTWNTVTVMSGWMMPVAIPCVRDEHAEAVGQTGNHATDGEDNQGERVAVSLSEDRNHPGVQQLAGCHRDTEEVAISCAWS